MSSTELDGLIQEFQQDPECRPTELAGEDTLASSHGEEPRT